MVRFHPRSLGNKVCKCSGSTRLWYGRRPGSIPGRTSDSNGLACSKGATDPCKISEKGSIPLRSTQLRKGNPIGDGIRLLAGRASRWCLEGSTPSPSALQNRLDGETEIISGF